MILLDTNAWVWWQAGSRKLSRQAARLLERERQIRLSVISVWEVGLLASLGRIRLDRPVREWVAAALEPPGLELVPLSVPIALHASELDRVGRDPIDRLVVAAAMELGCAVLTPDERIEQCGYVKTIW